ncbi:hypothetical protein GCM10023149_23410 [Mucilaginibacter gynuensis]|uniref:CHAT domain-containing protein n=1 Tax=Mucilaginibacter gynuensis TaxID=1302236 RepID=A0ABP8GEV8_9SPHI
MKTITILFTLLFLAAYNVSLAQDTDEQARLEEIAEIKKLGSMIKIINLEYQGKFSEAIPILTKRVDSLKIAVDKDPEQLTQYLHELRVLALMYEFTGDFSKSELLLKQPLINTVSYSGAEPGLEQLYTINQLSKLYEKMGNFNAAENLLEKMVFMEYGHIKPQTEKEMYRAYMFNLFHLSDSTRKAESAERIEELTKKTDAQSKAELAIAIEAHKELMALKPDTAELEKGMEQQWEEFSNPKIESEDKDEAAAMKMTQSLMKMIIRGSAAKPVNKPLTAANLALLRQGKITFDGYRNGLALAEPWSEVQRLFAIYSRNKNYTAAEALMKQAIAVDNRQPANEIDPTADFIKQMMPMGVAKMMDKQLDKKKLVSSNMLQLVDVNEKRDGVDVFYIQNNVLLAQLYKETGKTTQYNNLVDTVTLLCKKFENSTNPMVLNVLANSYNAIGKTDEAVIEYKKIVNYAERQPNGKVTDSKLYLSSLQKLANLYLQKVDFTTAEGLLKKALAYDKKTLAEKYPEHMERVLNLIQLYETTNRFNLAEQYFTTILGPVMSSIQNNFSFLSEQEKMALLNNQVAAFDLSASLLITDPNPTTEFVLQACNQQLRLKGLVLNDEAKLLNNIRKNSDTQLKQLVNQWSNNRSAIAWQYTRPASASVSHIIDSLTSVTNEQEKQINRLSASFSSYRQNNQVDISQVQRNLSDGETAIEFVSFKYYHKGRADSTRYGAFIIPAGSAAVRFVPLCEESKLAALLSADRTSSKQFITSLYGDGLTPGSNKITGRKSDALYKLIWQPLVPFLNGTTKFIIAPAGLLSRVNFNALPADKDSYFIDKFEIRLFNSIRQIAEKQNNTSYSGPDAVLYADINYGLKATNLSSGENKNITGSYWPQMPVTLTEANSLSALYNSAKESTFVITGDAATEESLKQLSGKSPRLLYIATHGFAKQAVVTNTGTNNGLQYSIADNPMFRSGIIMAGANYVWSGGASVEGKDDGVVTAYEIAGLDLSNTELVMLAACETALGDIKGNEGVFGLQRGFKLAGVQNMLLSLWNLPVSETIELTKQFYQQKSNNSMPIYQAFRSAQLGIRKNNPPYNWAGMILIE